MAGRYEFLPAEQEGYIGSALRNVGQVGARAAESAAGLIPDVAQAGLGLVNKGVEYATGKESPLPKQLPGTSPWLRENVTKRLTGNSLEPHSQKEERIGEFFGDLASLAVLPLAGAYKTGKLGWEVAKPILKKAGIISGAGSTASWLTKSLGGSEGKQTGAKVGAMLAASALSPERLTKYVNSLYTTAENSIPVNGGSLSVQGKMWPELNKLGKELDLGEMTPSKTFLRDRLMAVESKINKKNYTIPLNELWELKKNVNEYIKEAFAKGQEASANKGKELNVVLNDTLKGSEAYKKYPQFAKAVDTADAIETAQKQLGPISKFMQKHISSDKVQSGMAFALMMKPLETGSVLATAHLFPEIEKVLRSPDLMKYYVQSLGSAIKQDAPALVKNFNKFDKTLASETKKSTSGRYVFQ